jgi:DNA repair protein RecO (recombination protein O)
MSLIETESLVLKTYNLAEADRIVVFLTSDHGIVRGVARGARRLKSRFGSTLEPFSLIDVTYFQKEDRELVSIQAVDLIRSHFEQAADPLFLGAFSYIVDLLLQFTPPNDPNHTLFRMTKACLLAAPDTPAGMQAVILYFELWMLRLGGYLPDWSNCGDCRVPFGPYDDATLRGGFNLHCSGCRRSSGVMHVTPQHRELFTRIQKLSPQEFINYAAGRESLVKDLSSVMKRLIAQVIGSEGVNAPKAAAGNNAV